MDASSRRSKNQDYIVLHCGGIRNYFKSELSILVPQRMTTLDDQEERVYRPGGGPVSLPNRARIAAVLPTLGDLDAIHGQMNSRLD